MNKSIILFVSMCFIVSAASTLADGNNKECQAAKTTFVTTGAKTAALGSLTALNPEPVSKTAGVFATGYMALKTQQAAIDVMKKCYNTGAQVGK